MIKRLNTISPNGYNLDSGGCREKKRSFETIEKIKKANKGKPSYWKGRKRKPFTDEHRKKISLAQSGKNNQWYGKTGFSNNKSKSIVCIETNKIYGSMGEASRELDIPKTDISYCCNGKRKTAGGYHWQYNKKT